MFENNTVRILNLSGSKMNHSGNEFGSILGRLMVLNRDLIHLDVSKCGLSGHDQVYLTLCLLENNNIMALHLGYNNSDENTKNVIKALLGANEQDLLHKINSKPKKNKEFLKNKHHDFLLQRHLN